MPDIKPTPIFGVEFTRSLQDAFADGIAQKRGDTIGIQHVARGHGSVAYVPASTSNYSVTATSLTALDTTNLRTTLIVSGKRPVRVTLGMTLIPPGSNHIAVSVLMDGVSLRDRIIYTDTPSTASLYGFHIIPPDSILPGEHTFDIAARVSGGTGTIYCGGSNTVSMEVTEV